MGNQTLGRGKLYFDPFVSGTENTTGERYLGNTPSFGLTVETQEIEHYSAEEGLRVMGLLQDSMQRAQQRLIEPLTSKDQETFLRLLSALVAANNQYGRATAEF